MTQQSTLISLREMKTYVHMKPIYDCLQKLYSNCQKLCLSTAEWINKLWHTHTTKYNHNKKKEWTLETCSILDKSQNIQNERSQYQRLHTVWFIHVLEEKKISDGELISDCQWITEEGASIKGKQEGAVWELLCIRIMVVVN